VTEECSTCRFYLGAARMCRRYPTPVEFGRGHWCGEWRNRVAVIDEKAAVDADPLAQLAAARAAHPDVVALASPVKPPVRPIVIRPADEELAEAMGKPRRRTK
jgi:hypothetical protein